jgi:hypothetical protein
LIIWIGLDSREGLIIPDQVNILKLQ